MCLLSNQFFVHNNAIPTISRKENEFYLEQIKYQKRKKKKILWCHEWIFVHQNFVHLQCLLENIHLLIPHLMYRISDAHERTTYV